MATMHRKTGMWFLTVCFLGLISGCAQIRTDQIQSTPIDLTCAECGIDRVYYRNVGNAADPQDLVLVLHGFRSSATGTIARTKGAFEQLADGENTIVVHGQASGPNWVFGDAGSQGQSYDTTYFHALWHDVRGDYPSLKRIHLVGLSRGAMAAYFLACDGELPVASLTVFTMPMPEFSADNCPNTARVDFTLANGTADHLVPYLGGGINLPWYARPGGRDFGSVLSTEDTLAFWRGRNGCETNPSAQSTVDSVFDGTSVGIRFWDNCRGGDVAHYAIQGGGHRWVNSLWDPLAWLLLGSTTREIPTVPQGRNE